MGPAVSRRALLSLLALAASGCAGAAPPAVPPRAPAEPLQLDPAVDLVVSAGLVWLVDARPAALFADASCGAALGTVFPAERLHRFAERHGGVDLRAIEALVLARYPKTTLAVARTPFDPTRVEAAFGERAISVEGRSTERGVTRIHATARGEPRQLALFGRDAVAVEWGDAGPLQAAEYLAEGRLRRSKPALRAEPLARVATLLGPAPLRAFAPGPFEGAWAKAGAGLLGATTAVGGAMRPRAGSPSGSADFAVVLAGGWGADAGVAAERLGSVFGVLAADPLGQLTGLDRPLEGPRVSGDAEAIRLDVALDTAALARGLRAATQADIDEMMSY